MLGGDRPVAGLIAVYSGAVFSGISFGGEMNKPCIVLLAGALVSLPVLAAGNSTGYVQGLLAHEPGRIMFRAGTHTEKPACSTVGDQWAIDATTQGGRQMVNVLMLAAALNKTVTVHGSGSCTAWGDRESPLYLYMND